MRNARKSITTVVTDADATGFRKLCALLIHRAGGTLEITADEAAAFFRQYHTKQAICIEHGYPDNDVIRVRLTNERTNAHGD